MGIIAPLTTKPSFFRATFAALQYRNYRLWFFGQLVSLMGTWMQSTAQQYLIYDMTNSTFLLGVVFFAAGIPMLVLSPLTGLLADRIPRRSMLLTTQSSMMVLAFIMAFLKFTNLIQYWHIIILALLLGICNAFDAPSRHAFAVELVDDRKDLTNAIALNSAMFNAATIVGPAVSGMVYFLVGPAWCFTINAISFIAVIVALVLMKIPPVQIVKSHEKALKQIREGFQCVFSNRVMLWLILSLGMISLFGFGVASQSPAWAKSILGGDERTNGWMMTFRGIGSLAAAMLVASSSRGKMHGRLWKAGIFILPVFLALLAVTPWLGLSQTVMTVLTFIFVAFIGASLMLVANTSNGIIQSIVPDAMRGRVMGIYAMIFMGAMPLGSPVIGALATRLSLPTTVLIASALMLMYSLATLIFNPVMRRLEDNIDPEKPGLKKE